MQMGLNASQAGRSARRSGGAGAAAQSSSRSASCSRIERTCPRCQSGQAILVASSDALSECVCSSQRECRLRLCQCGCGQR